MFFKINRKLKNEKFNELINDKHDTNNDSLMDGVNPAAYYYAVTDKDSAPIVHDAFSDMALVLNSDKNYNPCSDVQIEDIDGNIHNLYSQKEYKLSMKDSMDTIEISTDSLFNAEKFTVSFSAVSQSLKNQEKAEKITNILNNFSKNKKDNYMVLDIRPTEDGFVLLEDINGNNTLMPDNHAFAIKDFNKEKNIITIVNPQDSSKEININADELYKIQRFRLFYSEDIDV